MDSKDRLLSDVTLYASYADNQPMEEVSMATYARANDVAADFTIPVTDTSAAMTPDQVRKNFTIKNVTDSSETVTVDVTEGADHTFTISNPNGWTPGAAYKLELQEKALYFTGFDPTIRVYDFTVYREEVKNVELNKEIKYIHKKELSNLTVNGKKVEEVSIAAMTIGTDGSLTEEGSDTTGTFTYKKQLEVGDQVAIYSGDVIPTMDMSSGDNSDVSFIEITGADGDKYTYRGSRPEDVLFMPDVLPLSMDKDQDGDPDNNSVTINVSDLTFGDDAMSRAMDLDSETTVDEGDYLALYTGTMGENESGTVSLYGEITSVLLSEGKYIVSYIPVSEEDMRQTMDVYQKENVEGEDLLEDTDVQALEEDIETQAVDSGFASEVAERVADAAMETESFEELQESLKEDMNADIMVQSQGYGQLRKARAAGGAGGVLQRDILLLGDLTGGEHTVSLGAGGLVGLTAVELNAALHRAARQEDARDVQTGRRHQHARNGFIAGANEHQAVQPVRPCHSLNAVCHKLTGRQRVAGTAVGGAHTVAYGNAAKFYRCAACTVNAVFDLLGQLFQMTVAGHNVRERVADTDNRTGQVIVGEAVRFVKGAAGDETVREKST